MKRVLHIFSEKKFIDSHISLVLNNDCLNTFVYLNEKNDYSGHYVDVVQFYAVNEYQEIIDSLESYDCVYIYYLDLIKAKIINRIPNSNINVFWHFYGAEIYNQDKFRRQFLSKATQHLLKENCWSRVGRIVKHSIKNVYLLIYPTKDTQKIIEKAIKRVNYFCWYSIEEYQFLNSIVNYKLPKFLFQPLANKYERIVINPNKKRDLIIGNSKSPFNNHIDVLNLIDNLRAKLSISLPFNYGSRSSYPDVLIQWIKSSCLDIKILDGFLDKKSYIDFVNEHKAFVFNSYRQMGLGNLFIAIACGLKIYINEYNPSYRWLINNNFRIYSIQADLKKDLISGNIQLNKFESVENVRAYSYLVK